MSLPEYYHILDADALSSVMVTPLQKAGHVTVATRCYGDDETIHLLPSDAMRMAAMTVEAAREADPEGFDALWEQLKTSIRENVRPARQ